MEPGKRPLEKKVVERQREITMTGLRDYNIITNRYLELHEDKTKTDKMIEKCELAEKYWKTHNYDPVSGQFYDPTKEEEFLVYGFGLIVIGREVKKRRCMARMKYTNYPYLFKRKGSYTIQST
jgi:hypothetical protein